MRNAFLAGASALALTLGGCSMFGQGDTASSAPVATQPQANNSVFSGGQTSQASAPEATNASPQYQRTAMNHRGHRLHASSTRVRDAQAKLKDDGDYSGKIDGKMGPQTHQAIKQYQGKNGLTQTAQLDRKTMQRLGASASNGSNGGTASDAGSNAGSSINPATAPSAPPAQPNGNGGTNGNSGNL